MKIHQRSHENLGMVSRVDTHTVHIEAGAETRWRRNQELKELFEKYIQEVDAVSEEKPSVEI